MIPCTTNVASKWKPYRSCQSNCTRLSGLTDLFLSKNLVVPIGRTFQSARNGILASVTGFTAIVVPAGFSAPKVNAPIRMSVGIEFLGRPWGEPELLKLAYGFEQATRARKPPESAPAGLSKSKQESNTVAVS